MDDVKQGEQRFHILDLEVQCRAIFPVNTHTLPRKESLIKIADGAFSGVFDFLLWVRGLVILHTQCLTFLKFALAQNDIYLPFCI